MIEAVNDCPQDIPVCHQTEYSMVATMEFSDPTMSEYCEGDCLSVSFANPIVENIKSEASYDFQSLIGEIGGTLSLFLGLSGLGLLEMLKPTKKWMNLAIKIFSFLLLLSFIIYAAQSIIKYVGEPLATTIRFVRGNMTEEFPYLTFCTEQDDKPFHDIILERTKVQKVVATNCGLELGM